MRTWVVMLLGVMLVPLPAHGASYGIWGHSCNGVETWVGGGPEPVSWDTVYDDCLDAQLWSEVEARAGRGVLRARIHSHDANMTGDHLGGAIADISAHMLFGDVIIEGPGLTVATSLRFYLHTFLSADSPEGDTTAGVEVDVQLGQNWFLGTALLNEGSDPSGAGDWELLDGHLLPVAGLPRRGNPGGP